MSARALLRYLRTLSPPLIEELLGRERVVRRAQTYAAEGRVDELWIDRDALRAHVAGSSETPYHSVIRFREGHLLAECSCPYERGLCWHVGSVLLSLVAEPKLFDELDEQLERQTGPAPSAAPAGAEGEAEQAEGEPPPEDPAIRAARQLARREAVEQELLRWPKSRVVALLADLSVADPLIEARMHGAAEEPTDLDLRLFRQAARQALRPGAPLRRFECARVAADLRELAASVRRLVEGGHPEGALDLLHEIAGLTWHRIEEADDRDGALTRFVGEVLVTWIHGWAEIEGRDRQHLAREIFGWLMEDAGLMTGGLILEARRALGPIGLETLVGLLKPLLDERMRSRPVAASAAEEQAEADPLLHRVRAALRETYEATGDLGEFLRLCDPSGVDGEEVVIAARRLEREGRLDEALEWTTRGRRRARGTPRAQLDDLRISLLSRLSRQREAVDAAWEAFTADPGAASFSRLLSIVNEHDRGEWRRRAVDHAEAGADATAFVEVCLAAQDGERLAHRLDAAPGFVLAAAPTALERAAALLGERHAGAGARICQHLASRLLADGDPRHYARVRHLLEQAQRAHQLDGSQAEWEGFLEAQKSAHKVVRAWFEQLE